MNKLMIKSDFLRIKPKITQHLGGFSASLAHASMTNCQTRHRSKQFVGESLSMMTLPVLALRTHKL